MTQGQSTHRIDAANISIHLNDHSADVDTAELRRWTVQVLLEEFDAIATEFCPADRWYVLPELSIDVEMPGEEFLHYAPSSRSALRSAFRRRILEQIGTSDGQPQIEYFTGIVLEYLESGTLPSSRRGARLQEALMFFMEHISAMDQGQEARIFETLKRADAYVRLLRHVGDAPLFELLCLRSGVSPDVWRRIVRALPQVLRSHPAVFRAIGNDDVLRMIFAVLPEEKTEPMASVQHILRRLLAALRIEGPTYNDGASAIVVDHEVMSDIAEALSTAGVPTNIETVEERLSLSPAEITMAGSERTTHPSVVASAALHIANAGVVLLAPFLKSFLASVDGLDQDGTLTSPGRVPVLLHYLATGERSAQEWQLTLPKILAGLDVKDICDTELFITEEEVLNATELLHSVIGLWDKLQGTSISGLRETFLSRQGTLALPSAPWRLRVEEETVDILLQFVPWPFHTIRLPWMRGILLVDW
jgi:hypothetical protein